MSENIFKITEQDFNEKLQSKDQQIKDLEFLLHLADKVIDRIGDFDFYIEMASDNYNNFKKDYQQKYPKQ